MEWGIPRKTRLGTGEPGMTDYEPLDGRMLSKAEERPDHIIV